MKLKLNIAEREFFMLWLIHHGLTPQSFSTLHQDVKRAYRSQAVAFAEDYQKQE
jgi:hypothetical protein